MKKTIKPDGSVVIEGEAEELAEYENAQKNESDNKKKKNKKLLTEKEVRAIAREEAIAAGLTGIYISQPVQFPPTYPWYTTSKVTKKWVEDGISWVQPQLQLQEWDGDLCGTAVLPEDASKEISTSVVTFDIYGKDM